MIGSFGMALRYSFGLIEAAISSTARSPTCWQSARARRTSRRRAPMRSGTGEMGDAVIRELEALS
jgi:3-isopropylmalate dehydrogenase